MYIVPQRNLSTNNALYIRIEHSENESKYEEYIIYVSELNRIIKHDINSGNIVKIMDVEPNKIYTIVVNYLKNNKWYATPPVAIHTQESVSSDLVLLSMNTKYWKSGANCSHSLIVPTVGETT